VPHIPKDLRRQWKQLNLPHDENFGAIALDRETQISEGLKKLETEISPTLKAPQQSLALLESWIAKSQTNPKLTWIATLWDQMPVSKKIEAQEVLFYPLKTT
jgi:hypothetical protein